MKDKRIVFMGTPLFAVPILKKLIENTNVVLVVSQMDKAVGRKKEIQFSPVKNEAMRNNIEVFQSSKIREDFQYILSKKPDIIITCAYGQIIPKELLYTPKYQAINVHASLLPKLRGGAPIHRAIIEGHEETGITIMYMNEKMDEGDIISQEKIKIEDADNVGTLHDKLSSLGSKLLIETLPKIFSNTNERIKQNELDATYAYNIRREDELIEFNKIAREVFNKIRGLYPFPIGYIKIDNEIVKLIDSYIGNSVSQKPGEITNIYKDGLAINCLDREIVITKLKPSGKKEMLAIDYINGKRKENLIGKVVNNEIF